MIFRIICENQGGGTFYFVKIFKIDALRRNSKNCNHGMNVTVVAELASSVKRSLKKESLDSLGK